MPKRVSPMPRQAPPAGTGPVAMPLWKALASGLCCCRMAAHGWWTLIALPWGRTRSGTLRVATRPQLAGPSLVDGHQAVDETAGPANPPPPPPHFIGCFTVLTMYGWPATNPPYVHGYTQALPPLQPLEHHQSLPAGEFMPGNCWYAGRLVASGFSSSSSSTQVGVGKEGQ